MLSRPKEDAAGYTLMHIDGRIPCAQRCMSKVHEHYTMDQPWESSRTATETISLPECYHSVLLRPKEYADGHNLMHIDVSVVPHANSLFSKSKRSPNRWRQRNIPPATTSWLLSTAQ